MKLTLASAALLSLTSLNAFATQSKDVFEANVGAHYEGINSKGETCSLDFRDERTAFAHYNVNTDDLLWIGVENFKATLIPGTLVYQYGGPWTLGCIITGNYCHYSRWELKVDAALKVKSLQYAVNGVINHRCDYTN